MRLKPFVRLDPTLKKKVPFARLVKMVKLFRVTSKFLSWTQPPQMRRRLSQTVRRLVFVPVKVLELRTFTLLRRWYVEKKLTAPPVL